MRSGINVYQTERLILDFSELTPHYKESDLKRLDLLKKLIEDMVVLNPNERCTMLDVTLRMYEIYES